MSLCVTSPQFIQAWRIQSIRLPWKWDEHAQVSTHVYRVHIPIWRLSLWKPHTVSPIDPLRVIVYSHYTLAKVVFCFVRWYSDAAVSPWTCTVFFTFFVNAYKGMAMMIGLYCGATVDVTAVLHRVNRWRVIISWELTGTKLLQNKRSLSLWCCTWSIDMT